MIRPLLLPGVLAATMLAAPRDQARPPARDIPAGAVAEFCGMTLQQHPGPKAQLFAGDRVQPYWFGSVREMFAFTMLSEKPRDIRAIYVTDLARARNWDFPEPGTWIEARAAVFVIGSRGDAHMDTDEAAPFGNAAAAAAFAARRGGRLVRFTGVPQEYILGYSGAQPPVHAARSGR